jgi:glutathione S-transferase
MTDLRSELTDMAAAELAAALARVEALEGALNVALGYAAPIFCTDAITCADWFVACAAVQCGLNDVDGSIAECIASAVAERIASADAVLKGGAA